MRSGLGLAVAMLLAGTAAAGEAQEQPFGLRPGQTVRVRAVDGARFETRLDGAFDPARVDSLWVRGNAAKTGAIVGAAIVTPASFAFFAWICTWAGEGSGCDAWGTVVGLSLASGAGGAGLGALVGALIPTWKLRYARDREATIHPLVAPGRLGLSVRF